MDHRREKRRPTIATKKQLAVLRKLQSESGNPTEEQRLAAAAETGLDEKWVKNWFSRQRSKNKSRLATTESRSTLRLLFCHPGAPSRRSVSTPNHPSPCPPPTTQAMPRSKPIPLDNPSQNMTLVSHTLPTYSRDPLCDRYPDFSQFFRPQGHERLRSSAPTTHNSGVSAHAPVHFQGAFDPWNPSYLLVDQRSSATLQSCPVAFSMKVTDILDRASFARYPILLPP